jgi:hypothetical protein
MDPWANSEKKSEGKTSVANYDMNGNSFRNTMHSLNYGGVMEQAARNVMKERKQEEQAAGNMGPIQYDLEDLEDDPELHALQAERIQAMKEDQEKRKVMESKVGLHNGPGSRGAVESRAVDPQLERRLVSTREPKKRALVSNFNP